MSSIVIVNIVCTVCDVFSLGKWWSDHTANTDEMDIWGGGGGRGWRGGNEGWGRGKRGGGKKLVNYSVIFCQ